MKKTLAFFLCLIICVGHSYSQKQAYTDQEFIFRELKMKEKQIPFQSGIEFSFRVFGKYNRDQIQDPNNSIFPSYQLSFFIVDDKGDTLVPSSTFKVRQSYSFFDVDTGKYKSYSFGHALAIPYSAFRKKGNQTFYVYGQAESSKGDIKLKPFKSAAFKTYIPSTVPLEKQQIKISNAQAIEDKSANGVTIKFSSTFLYSLSELHSDIESADNVYFYVDFTDENGNPINSPDDPRLWNNKKNISKYYRLTHVKNTPRNGEIFFPYADFYIPKGIQKIKYTIHATSSSYTESWLNLAKGELSINMPAVYFAKAGAGGIHVIEKSYDFSANDIPIVNIFLPSKSSSGKGYPDLFWQFGTSKRNYISTGVSRNTFYALLDSCSFQMLEDELLYLKVYDHDVLSGNDYLGGLNIPKLSGNTEYKTSIKNGDILDGQFVLKRSLRPDAKAITLFAKTTKHKGISGYQIWGSITKDESTRNKFFIRNDDGSNEIPKWTNMEMPEGANYSYFIPYWDLNPGSGFGIVSLDAYYQLPLCQKYTEPEKYIKESNDVTVTINPLQNTVKNGTEGMLVKVVLNYPEGLSDKTQLKFNYQFKDNSGVDVKKIIDKLKPISSPLCSEKDCALEVFVPYYLLADFSGKEMNGNFKSAVTIKENYTVGKAEKSLNAIIPMLIKSPKLELTLDLKMAKNWSYITISTEHNVDRKVYLKERIDGGKKLTFSIDFPHEYLSENDVISLVITPYEFRTAQEEIRWDFTWKDLKSGSLNLAKNKYAKNVFLKTN